MINWKTKSPGYYTKGGKRIFSWKQLKADKKIFIYKNNSDLNYIYNLQPADGVLVLPKSIRYINTYAFRQAQIHGVVLNEGLIYIRERAFCKCPVNWIEFPSSLQFVGRSAFRDCHFLKNVKIEGQLTNLGPAAFANCYQIQKVNIIAPGMIRLEEKVFDGCKEMHTCIIDAPLEYVFNKVFNGCNDLQAYHYNNTIKRANMKSFEGCRSLEQLIETKYQNYMGKYQKSTIYNDKNFLNIVMNY